MIILHGGSLTIRPSFFRWSQKMCIRDSVHKDVTERLEKINQSLARRAREVLDLNKSERHIRGGMATRGKYEKIKKNTKAIQGWIAFVFKIRYAKEGSTFMGQRPALTFPVWLCRSCSLNFSREDTGFESVRYCLVWHLSEDFFWAYNFCGVKKSEPSNGVLFIEDVYKRQRWHPLRQMKGVQGSGW